MSIFDLNAMGNEGGSTSVVFNNGIAGKVENVSVDVIKKGPGDGERNPDYKVVYTDDKGAQVNQGFYYYVNNDSLSSEENATKAGYNINRLLGIAKSLVPEGFTFPEVKSANEAIDTLMSIIKENKDNNKVNVFVTYGTTDRPSTYLNLRYFNFVEKAGTTGYSRLNVKGDDKMERPQADQPKEETMETKKSPW